MRRVAVNTAGKALDEAWGELSSATCTAITTQEDVAHKALKWITFLDSAAQATVLQCCTDSMHDVNQSMQLLRLGEKERRHVLMLRGLLAFRLLLHCLQKRHNVDYGITDR